MSKINHRTDKLTNNQASNLLVDPGVVEALQLQRHPRRLIKQLQRQLLQHRLNQRRQRNKWDKWRRSLVMSMVTNSSCQRHANRKWPACREDNLLRQRQRRNLRQSLRKLHPNQHLNKLIFLTWVEDLLQRQHLLRQLHQVVNLNSPLISCKEELKSQLQHRNHRPLISSILVSLVRHNLHRLHHQLRQPM